jgi:hypothetical protein
MALPSGKGDIVPPPTMRPIMGDTRGLVITQQRAHVHNNPQRRALAEPRSDAAARASGSGKARLAHHAGAHDQPNVRNAVEHLQRADLHCTRGAHRGVERGDP